MTSNRLITETRIPMREGAFVHAMACGGPRGRAILVGRIPYDADGWGRVERFRGHDRERLYAGELDDVVFPGGGVAYLQRGGRILALDLSSERVTPATWFRRGRPRGMVVGPDGARLATLVGPEIVVVDLATGNSFGRDVRPERYAQVAWMDHHHLVLFPEEPGGRAAVLHADRGRPQPVEGEWFGEVNVVSGRFAYGLHGAPFVPVRASRRARRARALVRLAGDRIADGGRPFPAGRLATPMRGPFTCAK